MSGGLGEDRPRLPDAALEAANFSHDEVLWFRLDGPVGKRGLS